MDKVGRATMPLPAHLALADIADYNSYSRGEVSPTLWPIIMRVSFHSISTAFDPSGKSPSEGWMKHLHLEGSGKRLVSLSPSASLSISH